jgi:hypothetical protein
MKAILCRSNRPVVLSALLLLLLDTKAGGGPIPQGNYGDSLQNGSYRDPVQPGSYGGGPGEVVLHVRGAS